MYRLLDIFLHNVEEFVQQPTSLVILILVIEQKYKFELNLFNIF